LYSSIVVWTTTGDSQSTDDVASSARPAWLMHACTHLRAPGVVSCHCDGDAPSTAFITASFSNDTPLQSHVLSHNAAGVALQQDSVHITCRALGKTLLSHKQHTPNWVTLPSCTPTSCDPVDAVSRTAEHHWQDKEFEDYRGAPPPPPPDPLATHNSAESTRQLGARGKPHR
jgi:hypothetical protein